MENDWISAADAFDLVGKATNFRAAQTICTRAHDGIIVARAQVLFMGARRSENEDVPAKFWWAGGHAALTQNWASGDFETWIDHRLHCRAYGVRFLKQDILAMLPPESGSSVPTRAGAGNYASASRCMEQLKAQLTCTERDAAKHIVRFCRAGLVEARCASFWFEVTDAFGPQEQEFENVAIPEW